MGQYRDYNDEPLSQGEIRQAQRLLSQPVVYPGEFVQWLQFRVEEIRGSSVIPVATAPHVLGDQAGVNGFNAMAANRYFVRPIFNPVDGFDAYGLGLFLGFVPVNGDKFGCGLWDGSTGDLVASIASTTAFHTAATDNGAHIYAFDGGPISLPWGPYYLGITQKLDNGSASLGYRSNMARGSAYYFNQTYGDPPSTLPALTPFGNGPTNNFFPAMNLLSSAAV